MSLPNISEFLQGSVKFTDTLDAILEARALRTRGDKNKWAFLINFEPNIRFLSNLYTKKMCSIGTTSTKFHCAISDS